MGSQRLRLGVLICLFLFSCAGMRSATRYHDQMKREVKWDDVAYHFGDWTGKKAAFNPIYGPDPAESSLLRIYRNRADLTVIAYAGFYSDLGAVMQFHTPEVCYPGQGWSMENFSVTKPGMYRGKLIEAQEAVVTKDETSRLVVWWYNVGSRQFVNRIRYGYPMLAMASLIGRTDGSMIRLEAPLGAGGEASARVLIQDFANKFLPELEKALPH